MTKEKCTLAKLNVKPGDVVECVYDATYGNYTKGKKYTVGADGLIVNDYRQRVNSVRSIFRIVSRASDTTPKTWGEMTDEEKGALLLAEHRGEVVEWINPSNENDHWDSEGFEIGDTYMAYRVRPPEPKRETVTLWGRFDGFDQGWGFFTRLAPYSTHRITMPLLDGNIPAGTYTSEAGETIIVEEL